MSEAPRYRYEFVLRLSGFGATPEEAWEQMQEMVAQDGLGDVPPETTRRGHMRRVKAGKDATLRTGFEDEVPDGALYVWGDEASGRRRPAPARSVAGV